MIQMCGLTVGIFILVEAKARLLGWRGSGNLKHGGSLVTAAGRPSFRHNPGYV